MKIVLWALGLMAISASLVTAQVTVEIVMDQDQFLRDESMPVAVRITNRSGQKLQLGQADWLVFEVHSRDGHPILQRSRPALGGEFAVENASSITRQVDLMPHYDLSKLGRYQVKAILKIEQWGTEVASKVKAFDIGRGSKVWEQEFGVPAEGGIPEVRKYELLQANYISRPVMYLRLTDSKENQVFRVFPLGPCVNFGRPEQQLDRESNLHVLFQSGARSFNYSIISPEGEVLTRQTHFFQGSRPVLRADEGKVSVSGGIRQVTANDIPAPPTTTIQPDAKATTP